MQIKSLGVAVALAGVIASGDAGAGQILDATKARGHLVCGTRGDTQGFARRDDKGRYAGLDVDMCRAVAAAIFGSSEKVKYVPLDASRRFAALQSGEVDMLASGTTYTLSREATLGVEFAAVYYFDGQAFMIPRKLGKRSARDLNGLSVCVQAGTTTAENVREYFRQNRMTYKPVMFDKVDDLRSAFFDGRCDVFTADRSAVYATRAAYAAAPNSYLVLPESASREPLALIVRQGDPNFAQIVRWALYSMLTAEEHSVSSRNVDEMLKSDNDTVKRLLGVTPGMGKVLGLDDRWAYNIIRQVGNYGEAYDRNVGSMSPLKIPRGLNELASQGGMQYAAPLR